MSILFFCSFFIILEPDSVLAQEESATLRVLVTSEEDGTPIIGANVVLYSYEKQENGEYEIIDAGATDQDGFLELRNISSDEYRLKISFIGHETYQEPIILGAGQTKVEEITLPVDVEELGEVVVEAEREITTGEVGVRRISTTDLSRIPNPGPSGDLASYMQTLPGGS